MDKTQSYFVYAPPKSNSHGHAVRDKNIIRATKNVIESFVSNFNATTDNKLLLTLQYDKKSELPQALKTIERLNEFLGPSKNESDNLGFDFIANSITWESYSVNVFDLLNYVNQIKDESFLPLSKYFISVFYSYETNTETEGFVMRSIESGRLFVRLHLIIPYPIEDEKSYDYFLNYTNHYHLNLMASILDVSVQVKEGMVNGSLIKNYRTVLIPV
jgi:hypothetical protein